MDRTIAAPRQNVIPATLRALYLDWTRGLPGLCQTATLKVSRGDVVKAVVYCRHLQLRRRDIDSQLPNKRARQDTSAVAKFPRVIENSHKIFDGFKGENATCLKQRGDLEIARRNGDSGVHE
jgi:hypothetical protein